MSGEQEIIDRALNLVRIEGLSIDEAARELGVDPKWLSPKIGRDADWILTARQVNELRARLAEQERSRDPISRLLGDPPPGRSALDRRKAGTDADQLR